MCLRRALPGPALLLQLLAVTRTTPPRVRRWEICVSATDGQFQQVSFVNSICTSKGGTHVDYLVNQIAK